MTISATVASTGPTLPKSSACTQPMTGPSNRPSPMSSRTAGTRVRSKTARNRYARKTMVPSSRKVFAMVASHYGPMFRPVLQCVVSTCQKQKARSLMDKITLGTGTEASNDDGEVDDDLCVCPWLWARRLS